MLQMYCRKKQAMIFILLDRMGYIFQCNQSGYHILDNYEIFPCGI